MPERDSRRSHHCAYDDKKEPFFKVGPLKIEYLAKKPLVKVIHDVLSDREISLIKKSGHDKVRFYPKRLKTFSEIISFRWTTHPFTSQKTQ